MTVKIKPLRVSRTMETETVLRLIAEEMEVWGQRNERGALGVLMGRLLEAHQSPRGVVIDHPFAAFIARKKRAPR
jgi:hypothetical protein